MTLGMIVRADHRGLATMTGLMHRCLQPARTLLVDMGGHSPTACHPDEFPGAQVVAYDDLLAGRFAWGPWLEGLTCVYTAETAYDPQLFSEARHHGVRTILHVMPELDPYRRNPRQPRPDVLALPTAWLADRYPTAPVLPVPAEPFASEAGSLVVHPGALAMQDRNGTRVVIDASLSCSAPVVVRCQQPPARPWGRASVSVADLPDTRDLYSGAALVVIPRRYGGLSLTIQETLSAGLPLLLPESDPYAPELPAEARLRAIRGPDLQCKGGHVPTWNCDADDAAARIDAVMADDALRAHLADASRSWAEAHRWENIRGAWDQVLGRIAA